MVRANRRTTVPVRPKLQGLDWPTVQSHISLRDREGIRSAAAAARRVPAYATRVRSCRRANAAPKFTTYVSTSLRPGRVVLPGRFVVLEPHSRHKLSAQPSSGVSRSPPGRRSRLMKRVVGRCQCGRPAKPQGTLAWLFRTIHRPACRNHVSIRGAIRTRRSKIWDFRVVRRVQPKIIASCATK